MGNGYPNKSQKIPPYRNGMEDFSYLCTQTKFWISIYMARTTKLLMLLALILLPACSDNIDNPSDNPQPTAIDAGLVDLMWTMDTSLSPNAMFDGELDEKDDTNPKFDCSGMNISVLSSKLSFSCGNQFATIMKDYGFPIMGERSGGGACCVQDMQTADGQNYRISTYRDRSTDKNFVNNDTGITPTEGYAFDYANFYNLDFLSNKMNKQ